MIDNQAYGELIAELSRRVEFHATIYHGGTPVNASPLYEQLCLHIARDEAVLNLMTGADLSTQVSNLLFVRCNI